MVIIRPESFTCHAMQLIKTANKPSLARVLALVALLCAGALQVQEAGHNHWNSLDDSYAQCLVCKAGTALTSPGLSVGLAIASGFVAPVLSPLKPPAPYRTGFLARGPPLYA